MLLITKSGIFEIEKTLADKEDSNLTVRACDRRDLETLRDRYLPTMEVITVDKSYYKYQARVSREDLQKAVSLIVSDIDYTYFGPEIDPFTEPLNLKGTIAYHKILATLESLRKSLVAVDPLRKSLGLTKSTKKSGRSLKAPCFGILFNKKGQVLLVEPADHLEGYSWTFPRTDKQKDETRYNAAIRCVKEESGYASFFVYALTIPDKYNTKATYCLLKPEAKPGKLDLGVAKSVRWVTVAQAEKLISKTKIAIDRERDLAVLKAAAKEFAKFRVEWN